MTARRLALALLAALAIPLGLNLATATNRFVNAYQVYDELGLEMTEFTYVDPDSPVAIVMVVSNPTDQTFEVTAIDMRLNVGVHRVGGGVLYLAPGATMQPGASRDFPLDLAIDDSSYVRQLGRGDIDWRVTGQIQVILGPGIDPTWIPFVVRRLPA